MITTILCDFSRVLIFPKETDYTDSLNKLYKTMMGQGFDPFVHFDLNTDLLHYLQTLKPKLTIAMFTSEILQNDPHILPYLHPVFDQIFSASDLGVSKRDTISYTKVAELLKKSPQEIVFIDDMPINIKAATEAGMHAIQYRDNFQIQHALERVLAA